ncbi:hypothetical protein AB0C07_24640 [Actinoplanes missouriensis]|uniref:hypothetical protein n=1 Tax=Actinoplanes missouriensis TaxID=1866 RepID=UPI0033DD269E
MDRKTAESLLRGGVPGHPVAEVLSAAKAPATERELAGEAAAMAAFRAAPPAAPRRSPMLTFLSFKVAAAAFATTATVGGVALAASTGSLPSPIFASSSAKPSPAPTSTSPSPSPSSSRAFSPRPKVSPSTKPPSSAKPRTDLAGLCREFDGRDRDGRTRALDDDRFGELIERAGRRERVERFCSDFRRPRAGLSATPQWPRHDGVDGSSDGSSEGGSEGGFRRGSNGGFGGASDGGFEWDRHGR